MKQKARASVEATSYGVTAPGKQLMPVDDPSFGDCWRFVAVERNSKLVLNFTLGKRDQVTTNAFIEGLRHATAPKPFQVTADGFPAYPFAIEATLADRVDFAQLFKVCRATPEGEPSVGILLPK